MDFRHLAMKMVLVVTEPNWCGASHSRWMAAAPGFGFSGSIWLINPML
jgi:hypothetical protein